MGLPGSSDGKESTCNAGDSGLIPGSGRSPREGYGNPPQYSCLENPHGQRSLVGYCPWSLTERLSTTQRPRAHALKRSYRKDIEFSLIWKSQINLFHQKV